MGTAWRSRDGTVTAKGKKLMLGLTDILKSNKRPEISTPHDPLHVTPVRFDSSTHKPPKYWKRLLRYGGTSKSVQEKDILAVIDVDKFYQEGGDVSDRMDPILGSSRTPPISTAAHAGVYYREYDSPLPTVSAESRPPD
jgi:p21-activated kinase 1